MSRIILIAALMSPVAAMASIGPELTLQSAFQTTPVRIALSNPKGGATPATGLACYLPDASDHEVVEATQMACAGR